GKHCACAVPMATDLEDLNQIIAAQERSGKNYMMMETTVYSSEFRAIESLYRAGRMGELTLYHGVHIQNLDGYPPYWLGLDRKSTRLNSSHVSISYAVFCLKKKKIRLRFVNRDNKPLKSKPDIIKQINWHLLQMA